MTRNEMNESLEIEMARCNDLEKENKELRALAGELLRVIELAPGRCGEKDLVERAKEKVIPTRRRL